MKQVRQAAFETNSSSSHSITIAAGEFIPDRLGVVGGVCEIFTGEFGWGYDHFSDASIKAAYCLTWIKHFGEDKVPEETAMFINVIKKVTGAKEVVFVPQYTQETKGEWDYYQWGYIDHQSIEYGGGTGREAFESEEVLERFIFNHGSILTIDNDNH